MKNMSGGRWRSWDFPCFPMCGKGKWVLRSFQTILSKPSMTWSRKLNRDFQFKSSSMTLGKEKRYLERKQRSGGKNCRERVKSLKGGEILAAVLSQSFQKGKDYTELLRSISILPLLKKLTGWILHYFSRFICI